jgi:hypothetical protein
VFRLILKRRRYLHQLLRRNDSAVLLKVPVTFPTRGGALVRVATGELTEPENKKKKKQYLVCYELIKKGRPSINAYCSSYKISP